MTMSILHTCIRLIIGRSTGMLSRFGRSRNGIAAVEFAIVLPFMALLYLGGFEVTQEIAINRLVVLSASTVANLVTQYSSISASQTMPDILNASAVVLTPYSAANAVVTVSCITIDSKGNATIAWSQALNGTPRTTGQSVNLPAALDVPNTTVVWGETTYKYTPPVNFLNLASSTVYSTVYMLPRANGTITLTP